MEKIGVCDWGIGGIGMLQHLKLMQNYEVVYLSDAGFMPYGKVAEKELSERWNEVKAFFKSKNINKIAIACNALSTVVELNDDFINVIESGLALVKDCGAKRIGVTGGYRTIESNSYKTPLEAAGYDVVQSVGQVLSSKVEAGDLVSEETTESIREVFSPLINCDYVVLACTHYPVLSKQILSIYPQIKLLDPALKMAETISNKWKSNQNEFNIEWYTTGNTETMIHSARISFNENIINPLKVVL